MESVQVMSLIDNSDNSIVQVIGFLRQRNKSNLPRG